MSDAFSNLSFHLVFSTTNRLPLLKASIRGDLFFYIAGIVKGIGGTVIAVGGMPNHAHLLIRLPAKMAVADAVRLVKGNSSKWMNEKVTDSKFGWQAGYGAFSVSQSALPVVIEYVRHQEQHHRRRSFADEIAILMARHEIGVEN